MNNSTKHSSPPADGQSDLVQFCLPDTAQDEARRYAWAISLTLLFLAIGGVGAKERVLIQRSLAPIEEQVMEQIEITQAPPPPTETTEEVARAVVYLASEYDGFITGATLDINGGVYYA